MSIFQKKKLSKNVKALITGAEFASKGASAASAGLGILALGVTISNPIVLSIVGGVGALFCCAGTCYAMNQPDDVLVAKPQDQIAEKKAIPSTQQHSMFNRTSTAAPMPEQKEQKVGPRSARL